MYRGWDQLLPAEVEPCLVQLPRRENRRGEPPFTVFPSRPVDVGRDDADLAVVLQQIGEMAQHEGFRHDGFWGWDRTPVADFIQTHIPDTLPVIAGDSLADP